jgi:tetratricopeptide (TPR) repeat protein
MLRRRIVRWVAAAACAFAACRADDAHREYLRALEAADRGAPIAEQLAHVERAIGIAPDRAPYYELRAGYRRHAGDFDGAEADYGRAIELRERAYLYFERGNVIASRGDPARALADLDRAIALEAWNHQFYRSRALARAAAGRGAAALADADVLARELPQQGQTWHARGVALLALGRVDEARADLERAAEMRPELAYVHADLARARERVGDAQGAAAARAREAETRNPGCPACGDPYH